MYFWQIAEDKNYLDSTEKEKDLQKTLKYTLSNLRKICKTKEYDVNSVCIGYLFEYIKSDLIELISLFTDPTNRNLLVSGKHNLLNLEWNKYFFDICKKFHIPDFLYWFFINVPYFYRDNIDIRRDIYLKMINYINDNWDPEDYFLDNQFLFMTQSSYQPYPLVYHNKSNKDIMKAICKLIRKICPGVNYTSNNLLSYNQGNIIKICFVSDSLMTDSSVLRDRMGVIRNLPSTEFDVYFASTIKPSEIKGKVCKVFYRLMKDKFIQLDKNNLVSSRQRLDGKFHIIVYPDIGMRVFQTFLSYSRLAKVQINTWGHSDTSGIDTLDYYITSKYFEPDNQQQTRNFYSEKVILMNSLSTYYYPADVLFLPKNFTYKSREYFGFSNEDNIYWCMQTFYKFNQEFEETIGKILELDPNAKLLMTNCIPFSKSHLTRLKENFGEEGINKLRFYPSLNKEVFLNLVKISDVCLDPFPFGGCNSSLEAFTYDVPVVTFPGNYINGRFTLGFYKKMGVMDCVVWNKCDYITLAHKLATDFSYNKLIRSKISSKKSSLFYDKASVKEWSVVLKKSLSYKNK